MISWYITFSFRFYYYTYRYSFVKYFNESPKECLKAVRSNDTIAAFLRTNLIHIHVIYIYTHILYIYIYYIYTHIIYIYIYTHTYSIVLNFSSFFAVARLFVYARDSTHGIQHLHRYLSITAEDNNEETTYVRNTRQRDAVQSWSNASSSLRESTTTNGLVIDAA